MPRLLEGNYSDRMVIKPSKQLALLGLIAFLSFFRINNGLFAQSKPLNFSYTLGLTQYSYLNDGALGSSIPNSYPKSIITAPTFGLDLYHTNSKFGVETAFYTAFTPSTDNLEVFPYVKNFWLAGTYYRFYNFRVSAFYAISDNRNRLFFNSSQRPYNTFTRGLGLAVSYSIGNADFSIRKEFAYLFSERFNSPAGLYEHFVLNIQKRFSFQNRKELEVSKLESPLTFAVGLGVSGNELRGVALSMPRYKFFPTVGLEFLVKSINTSLYARRAVWFFPENLSGLNLNLTSQLNYVGLAYHHDFPEKWGTIKMGMHVFWNATRGQQFWDNIQNDTITDENLWFNYQNHGLGLDLRYSPYQSNFDFVFNMDVYLKAQRRVGTGLNRESFRFSILYNF